MKFSFNLDWNEIPEEVREEKITKMIAEDEEEYECDKCSGFGKPAGEEINCEKCNGTGQIKADPDDQKLRDKAERYIEAHFPIYF